LFHDVILAQSIAVVGRLSDRQRSRMAADRTGVKGQKEVTTSRKCAGDCLLLWNAWGTGGASSMSLEREDVGWAGTH
jgi:hypothetical protein